MADSFDRQQSEALLRKYHSRGDWPPDSWNSADLLHSFGNGTDALLYASLFVPEFVEVEGIVFLKNLGISHGDWNELAERIRATRAVSAEALRAFLQTCNWVEVPYLFSAPTDPGEAYDMLAALMADAWRARLAGLFPDRCFIVRMISAEEAGGAISIGFEAT